MKMAISRETSLSVSYAFGLATVTELGCIATDQIIPGDNVLGPSATLLTCATALISWAGWMHGTRDRML